MKIIRLMAALGCLSLAFFIMPKTSVAQGYGGGMRRDPAQMVAAEKKLLFDSLTTLNGDQKLIIDQIYKDYEQAFSKAVSNADPDNRETMRATMMSIREGKNESIKAILTEEQYKKYEEVLKARRASMGQRRRSNDQ